MNSKIKILVDDKEIDYYTFADEIRNGDYFFKENGEWYLHKRPTIIVEEKKIPEKLGFIVFNEDHATALIHNKVDEIIDYLKSKGE